MQPYSNQPPLNPPPRKGWSETQIALTIILSTVLLVALCALSLKVSSLNAPEVHYPQTWTAIQTFSGNGNKQTDIFAVVAPWRLSWSCVPSSDYFGQYNVIVNVWNSDGTAMDRAAVNTICQVGNVSDVTTEHQSGAIYLEVISESYWNIQVQEIT